MKAVIFRTSSGSIPTWNWTAPSSPRISVSLSVQESGGSERKNGCSTPSISLQTELNPRSIRRVSSEPDVVRSGTEGLKSLTKLRSRSFPSSVQEEEGDDGPGSFTLTKDPQNRRGQAADWPQCTIPVEEMEFSGGGIGRNWKSGGGGGGGDGDEFKAGDYADRKRIGEYYKEMLKSNPNNPLLLRNYGKYLHEVEGDVVRAEEYYERAILASPGDGEVLSLYGNLIWEKEKDERRAKSYLDQAVQAAPDDCMVLGSYAHFMWQAADDEQEEDDVEEVEQGGAAMASATAMVEAF